MNGQSLKTIKFDFGSRNAEFRVPDDFESRYNDVHSNIINGGGISTKEAALGGNRKSQTCLKDLVVTFKQQNPDVPDEDLGKVFRTMSEQQYQGIEGTNLLSLSYFSNKLDTAIKLALENARNG